MSVATAQLSPEETVRRVAQAREALVSEVHKVIIGQDEMIEQMMICIFARGHCLTIGVPGLAKTLTVSTLSQALHLKFSRIQFTPDLMPSDITGTEIIDQDQATGKRSFRFVRGPVFANIVLADEINRTPPKTQAALLQAMQEHEVTVAGSTYQLDQPFFVMATQNPIEQEGTYPLPEAQLDRFMLSISIGYPTREEERDIVMATTQTVRQEIRPVLQGQDILWIQQLVRSVPTSQHMV
ncbi:MAG: AAA family ATPase, partial [Planctomycetota bacterium]